MDETETQTQAAPAAQRSEPSRIDGMMTEASLASVLRKSRAAQRASQPAQAAPAGDTSDAPTDDGSTSEQDDAQGQPTASSEEGRTDDSTLEEGAETDTETETGEAEDGQTRRQKKEQRRWDRLTAQLKAKDRELEQLRQQVEGGREKQPQRQAPAFSHPELQQLDSQIRQARSVLEWCESNPDGGEVRGADGKMVELSAADVRRYKVDAQAQLSDLAGQKAARQQTLEADFERRRNESAAVLKTEYPEYLDPDSEQFAEAVEYLGTLPSHVVHAMQSLPDSRLLLADLMAGRRARMAKATQAKAGGLPRPASARPTPQPGRVGSAAPRVAPERRQLKEATTRFASSGRMSDFREVLAAQRRAKRTAA